MTILQLIKNTNPYNVAIAYEKLFPYEEYDWLMSRNLKNVFEYTQIILKILDDIKSGKYTEIQTKEPLPTIYVFEFQNEYLGEKTTSFQAFTLDTIEIKTIYDFYENRKEILFSDNYEKSNVYMNYQVFQKSIDAYGIDICATTILHTLILFGYGEDNIHNNIERITKELDKSMQDIKDCKTYTTEEVREVLFKKEKEIYNRADKYTKAVLDGYDAKKKILDKLSDEFMAKIRQENVDNLYAFLH